MSPPCERDSRCRRHQIADLDVALPHRTPWIVEGFLELKGSDRFIVTATKGFGKTLLLKAKRILRRRHGGLHPGEGS
jgi:hypothetical protein